MNLFDKNLINISDHITAPQHNTIELMVGKHTIKYEKHIKDFEVVINVHFDDTVMDCDIPARKTEVDFWHNALLDAYWDKPAKEVRSTDTAIRWFDSHTKEIEYSP
jgi:hypothetical protein